MFGGDRRFSLNAVRPDFFFEDRRSEQSELFGESAQYLISRQARRPDFSNFSASRFREFREQRNDL